MCRRAWPYLFQGQIGLLKERYKLVGMAGHYGEISVSTYDPRTFTKSNVGAANYGIMNTN